MKFFAVSIVAAIIATTVHASAQQLSADEFCNIIVPQMLTFTENVPKISASFDEVFDKNFSPSDRERFADVKAKGDVMAQSVKDYRMAFLAACYSK